jgi:hypothetical protein
MWHVEAPAWPLDNGKLLERSRRGAERSVAGSLASVAELCGRRNLDLVGNWPKNLRDDVGGPRGTTKRQGNASVHL